MNINNSNIVLRFKKKIAALFVIILLATFLNLWNNDFPLGYHPDEVKKVRFILTNTQDFRHPILMLNIVRLANLLFGYVVPDHVVLLGRTIMALFGTLLVIVFYALALRLLTPLYALFATLTLASTPIIVVHSHYLKEDILFSFFSLLSLLAYFSFLKNTDKLRTLYLGLSVGFALSAQYKTLFLLPIFLIGPFLFRPRNRPLLYKNIFIAMAVSAVIFMVVNYPIFNNFSIFKEAVYFTSDHIQRGHDLKIYPLPHFFSFHLLNSIVPGITPLVTVLSLLFLCYFLVKWKRLKVEERILLCYLGIFYVAHEITPMKPYPDFMRYMIPVVPVLIYFLYKGLEELEQHLNQIIPRLTVYIILLFIFILPLQSSIRLDYHLNRDTREKAEEWLKGKQGLVLFERYSTKNWEAKLSLTDVDLQTYRSLKVKYLVASSFLYERYEYGAQLSGQSPDVYRRHNGYRELFLHPYVEIKPAYKSFAFSNPTIRIIDMAEKLDDL